MESDPTTEPPITVYQIDAILPFLATFEAAGYRYGEWEAPKGQLGLACESRWNKEPM
jgi:hypothetical protein